MIAKYRVQCAVLGVLAAATTASAQTQIASPPPGNMWSHGSTLNVFGGAAATSADQAPAAGGAFGWEITPRFALEGSGTWLNWGDDAHAFAATMVAQAALATPRPLVPFVAGGVGLYHASFNRSDSRMPGFYRRRMMAPPDLGNTISFTDPSLVGGGGINVFLGRHWSIRPEVIATVVLRNSRSFVVTTGTVHLAYHFEDHPVTPSVQGASRRSAAGRASERWRD